MLSSEAVRVGSEGKYLLRIDATSEGIGRVDAPFLKIYLYWQAESECENAARLCLREFWR